MRRRLLLLLTLTLLPPGPLQRPAAADSWSLPEKTRYHSPNKKFYLEVTPKKLESQLKYFEDKVEGRGDAGARKGVKENRAKGAFYARRADGGYSKRGEFPLVNEVSPVSALVSDGGAYVVTFDNWHRLGYGDDVVVIYRSDGSLVRKFGLEDLLTPGDVETLPHSVSSIHWGGEHYLDEAKGLLVLRVVSNGTLSGREPLYHELKIELATGRPLEPKRDLFTQLRALILSGPSAETTPEAAAATPDPPSCVADAESADGATSVPPARFYARAKERPLPAYPPIAKAARVSGTVVVELLVSTSGEALCARAVSGHALLRKAAADAALKWKFEPGDSSGHAVKTLGTVAFTFKPAEPEPAPAGQPQH